MTSTSRLLYRSILSSNRILPLKRKWQSQLPVERCISTTAPRSKNAAKSPTHIALKELDQEDRDAFLALSPEDQEDARMELDGMMDKLEYGNLEFDPGEIPELPEEETQEMEQFTTALEREENKKGTHYDFPKVRPRAKDLGFWAMDEGDDEDALVEDEDEEFKDDDITSMAHADLELHREVRGYTRLAAWEMPFLSQLHKPFHPPNAAVRPLRFRYTTYMGEHHPAAKKVVVDFKVKDLPNLSESQQLKLLKLLGPRYNPDTKTVKMSCERFDNPAQNKRFLADTVQNLLTEARNEADMFEDVPLDLRHHKAKVKPRFPDEWKLTSKTVHGEDGKRKVLGENAKRLLLERAERKELEEQRRIVDGDRVLEHVAVYSSRSAWT